MTLQIIMSGETTISSFLILVKSVMSKVDRKKDTEKGREKGEGETCSLNSRYLSISLKL